MGTPDDPGERQLVGLARAGQLIDDVDYHAEPVACRGGAHDGP
jgi:hypothetical protein